MNQECPLCGSSMQTLQYSSHFVPYESYDVDFPRQSTNTHIDGFHRLSHVLFLGDDPVELCACGNCGYVKVVKSKQPCRSKVRQR